MRKFEKISYNQFVKDINSDESLYKQYNLPKRSTKSSAGYDFESVVKLIINPGEIKKVPLAVKVQMEWDECLLLLVRSSQGFKYNVRMCNQVGVIDSDYYNNEMNEGHMFIKLQNHGSEPYVIHIGDKICQGIFTKYLLTDDDDAKETRTGGFGSTN